MKISNKVSLAILSASVFLGPIIAHAATSPSLGTADSFSVLAQTGITGTATLISGDVGNPDGAQITALTTAMVNPGTIYTSNGAGPSEGTIGANVMTDLTAAYGFLDTGGDNATCYKASTGLAGTDTGVIELGGKSLAPGVYCTSGSFQITAAAGPLTLVGTTGTWIFKSATTIDPLLNSVVTGGDSCNVWWRAGSAVNIGNSASLRGTFIAHTGIAFGTGVTINGRALAEGANVTLNSGATISGPTCAAVAASLGSSSINVPIYPLINVTKIPSPLNLPAGPGPVTYTYKVTNIGIVPVTNVSVKDDKCSPTNFVSGDTNNNGILDLTETWSYSCSKTVSQTETNVVTACGSAANTTSSGSMCDTAQATVAVGVPVIPPLIHVVKTPSTFLLPAGGGLVTYQYYITNPGTEPLNNVGISDDKCPGLPVRIASHAGDINSNKLLDPGETWNFSCVSNLTKTTTNTGTATGSANGFTATDSSSATVVVLAPGLPNTGLPPYGTSTPMDAAIVVGILMAVLAALSFIQKRRNA